MGCTPLPDEYEDLCRAHEYMRPYMRQLKKYGEDDFAALVVAASYTPFQKKGLMDARLKQIRKGKEADRMQVRKQVVQVIRIGMATVVPILMPVVHYNQSKDLRQPLFVLLAGCSIFGSICAYLDSQWKFDVMQANAIKRGVAKQKRALYGFLLTCCYHKKLNAEEAFSSWQKEQTKLQYIMDCEETQIEQEQFEKDQIIQSVSSTGEAKARESKKQHPQTGVSSEELHVPLLALPQENTSSPRKLFASFSVCKKRLQTTAIGPRKDVEAQEGTDFLERYLKKSREFLNKRNEAFVADSIIGAHGPYGTIQKIALMNIAVDLHRKSEAHEKMKTQSRCYKFVEHFMSISVPLLILYSHQPSGSFIMLFVQLACSFLGTIFMALSNRIEKPYKYKKITADQEFQLGTVLNTRHPSSVHDFFDWYVKSEYSWEMSINKWEQDQIAKTEKEVEEEEKGTNAKVKEATINKVKGQA